MSGSRPRNSAAQLGIEAQQDALQRAADQHAANVLPVIREIQREGATSLRDIADALNARGITTPRGVRDSLPQSARVGESATTAR
jgi:hypothetical protein